MPKESRKYSYTYKPVYESRKSSEPSGQAGPSGASKANELSIQERLARLRSNPPSRIADEAIVNQDSSRVGQSAFLSSSTVPPDLQEIFGTPPSHPPAPRVPRGFIAPPSWRGSVVRRPTATTSTFENASAGSLEAENYKQHKPHPCCLPGLGLDFQDRFSLINIIMKHIARNSKTFQHDNLWHLSPSLKSLLLEHIGTANLPPSINHSSNLLQGRSDANASSFLLNLFPTVNDLSLSEEEHTNMPGLDEGIEHLDNDNHDHEIQTLLDFNIHQMVHLNLAKTIGYGITLKQLLLFFAVPSKSLYKSSYHEVKAEGHIYGGLIPENWEDEHIDEDITSHMHLESLDRCANGEIIKPATKLDYLSLAYPHPATSHEELLRFLLFMPTITHLSIAGWPSTHKLSSLYQWTSFTKKLSQCLLCLQYLDISDCDSIAYEAFEKVDWSSNWRKVSRLVLRQNHELPSTILDQRHVAIRSLCSSIRSARKQAYGDWCECVL